MKKILYGALSLTPMLAFAQSGETTVSTLQGLVISIKGFLNAIIPILIALAVIYFFWGLVTYIRASGDEKARAAGKSQMLWGIIAIAIMVSLFGLIAWLQNTLGITSGGTITPPQIP
jgi:hypothetical protein